MIPHKEALIQGILSGNRAMLARCITFAESQKLSHRVLANEVLTAILPHTGHAVRIGITGVPGVGKSTFIEKFGLQLIAQGHRVAVLAIDPSSSKTGGSILGDKTRMEKLSVHPDAFIRPTASGKTLGGLAAHTQDAILLCEAAGYDRVIIETVGVGQSETEVYNVSDFFLLLMLAGAGDELQGIKRGIMEMCDGMVINKADGSNIDAAKVARSQYGKALHFFPPTPSGWSPPVLTASALEGVGIDKVVAMIDEFIALQKEKAVFQEKRNFQNLRSFEQGFLAELEMLVLSNPLLKTKMDQLKEDIFAGKMTANAAIQQLFQSIQLLT